MRIIETVVRRPISAIVIIIGIVLFGFSSMVSMPQELTPELNMPMLIVNTVYPTAGPEDVEKLVSKEVEGAVASLSGIKSVSSYSMDSVSLVLLEYEYGTDMDTAYSDVRERMDSIVNSLPSTAQSPVVFEMDMNAMDTMSLSVRSGSSENLLGYIDEEIVPEFEKLSTVADVSVVGGKEEYIRVELKEEMLKQYGVTMSTVQNSVSSADFSIPSGSADYGSQSLSVRSSVEFKTVKALENIPIPLGSGNIIRLGDVADVYMTSKDVQSISRYNGEDNISIGIQKVQSASAVNVSRDVRRVIDRLNQENPNFTIDIVDDNSDTIQSSLVSVGQSLVLAVVLSMLILFLFFGDVKASLIVGSSMPVSLLVAFILMDFMGFSLNVVTMSAMVLGVGMMVDNSIVVIDSCFKSCGKDMSFEDAAIKGTKSVVSSIMGGTVTTVVVFLPLATIQGMSGQLFTPLGFTIVFALTASLMSAITLVPLFFVQFKPVERRNAPVALLLKKIEHAYGNLLKRLLKRKKTVFAVAIGLVAASLALATMLNMELMPNTDQGIVSVSLTARPGLQISKVDELILELEEMVAEHPDVERYTVRGGGSGMTSLMSSATASVTAYLKDDRDMETDEVVDLWRRETKDYVNGNVEVSSTSMTMSITSDNVAVNLKGDDLDALKEFTGEVESYLKQRPDILSVSTSLDDPTPQAEIIVDPMKAAAYNLTPMQVASNVNAALSGTETSSLRQGGQEYKIWVEYPQGRYENVNDLKSMILVSPTGASVPLTDIASIEFADTPQTIIRTDSQYNVTIEGTPVSDAKFTAQKELDAYMSTVPFPQGVSLATNADQQQMMDEFAALGAAILTAVWLVFMVMAIQFESVKYSLMVMICIPFSMIGSLALMFLTRTTISMVSLLGFLILVGTVVNNGILFVDTTNQYRKSMDLNTSLVYTGRTRLRPILMTTLTTILSMLPMAFASGSAEMMRGLALVVIGGLLVSTLLTLLLLPTFYLIIEGNPEKKAKRSEKRRQRREKKNPVEE